MPCFLEIELLRGKNYPQTEDDPNPCTTQVRASLFVNDFAESIAAEQCSSLQENSNSPFYKDLMLFEIPEGVDAAVLILKVFEFSRKSEPFTILYGMQDLLVGQFKSKRELTVQLTASSPMDQPEGAARELAMSAELGDRSPSLSMRIHIQKNKAKSEAEDPNADVEIRRELSIDGSCTLVPADSQYVWLKLVSDKKWSEAFRASLTTFWRTRPALDAPEEVKKARRPTKSTEKPPPDVRSVGDVLLNKWGCCRSHQVLTRLRITAEKYARGEAELCFTTDEERQYRMDKKERAFLLNEMCQATLSKSTGSNLRDWLERLWALFTVGIDNDPSGNRTLSYEVRKRVHESQFDDDDAVILQSCILYFWAPTMPFEVCQSISETDYRNSPEATDAQTDAKGGGEEWASKITTHQRRFTKTLITLLGPMMDTLTEAELLRMAKAIKPAVWDAQQRIQKGGKSGIRARIRSDHESYIPRGDGIPIDHLDKLGRRKKSNKFA